jgi:hypothetical protein
MLACPTSHVNSDMYDIEVKVRGGGDGMSWTALALVGITSHFNCYDNEFNGNIRKGRNGRSGTPLALARHTPPKDGGNNVIVGKVREGGDGLSGMELASAGTKSQSNGGNNEIEGKVRGGERVVEEEVGGRRETVKLIKAACAITKTISTYCTPYTNSLYQILGLLGSILQSHLRLENVLSKLSTRIPLQINMALKKATRSFHLGLTRGWNTPMFIILFSGHQNTILFCLRRNTPTNQQAMQILY